MQEDIVNAMALTGQVLMGQSVMVKSSEVSTPQKHVFNAWYIAFAGISAVAWWLWMVWQ